MAALLCHPQWVKSRITSANIQLTKQKNDINKNTESTPKFMDACILNDEFRWKK